MTLQVLYVASSGRIVQWQDTELFGYPETPEGMALLEVSPEQFADAGIFKSVVSGSLSEEEPVEAPAQPDPEQLAIAAINKRDGILRELYEPRILKALRSLRLASSSEALTYAAGKIMELDLYAEALEAVPDQPGFPVVINWPETPSE